MKCVKFLALSVLMAVPAAQAVSFAGFTAGAAAVWTAVSTKVADNGGRCALNALWTNRTNTQRIGGGLLLGTTALWLASKTKKGQAAKAKLAQVGRTAGAKASAAGKYVKENRAARYSAYLAGLGVAGFGVATAFKLAR